eukprot:Protomagalhaensia_wolfi_Nauph_80__4621@NODE_477_length_2458_cov_95_732534_g327_i2_p1_GENE_NODE_477_length_2458_cov_95_732534_g327_i2NODE_477_length_2458_cov_95_732534_g327_i2_p1_ORF_typecomplete_len270_score32_12_NODE_477_length_2458_cov_95_732534_g327_i24451254
MTDSIIVCSTSNSPKTSFVAPRWHTTRLPYLIGCLTGLIYHLCLIIPAWSVENLALHATMAIIYSAFITLLYKGPFSLTLFCEVPATFIVIDCAVSAGLLVKVFNDQAHRGCSLLEMRCLGPASVALIWLYLLGVVALLGLTVYHLAFGSPALRRRGLALHFLLNWISIACGTAAVMNSAGNTSVLLFVISVVLFSSIEFSLIRWFPYSIWDSLCMFVFFYMNIGSVCYWQGGISNDFGIFVPLYGNVACTWLSAVSVGSMSLTLDVCV